MSGIIENANDLKELYLQTNLTDVAAVQTAIKDIRENAYTDAKEKYLTALNTATPAGINKARKYNRLTVLTRNLGWGIMALAVIWMLIIDADFDDAITTWQSVAFWVGAGIQIYITVLKNAWNKLTLSGSVLHPDVTSASTGTTAPKFSMKSVTAANKGIKTAISQKNKQQPAIREEKRASLCDTCGHQNPEGEEFCEKCGAKL